VGPNGQCLLREFGGFSLRASAGANKKKRANKNGGNTQIENRAPDLGASAGVALIALKVSNTFQNDHHR